MNPDIIASLIGGGVGFLARTYVENQKRLHFERLERLGAAEDSRERASGVVGFWIRWALLGIVAFSFISVIIAAFFRIPVIVETEVTRKFLFWSKTTIEYVELNGVPFFKENRTALLTMIFFYFGQSIK